MPRATSWSWWPTSARRRRCSRRTRRVFHTTPHYDGYPAVLVDLEAVEIDELTELITDAWLVKAPPKVRKDHPEVGAPG